MVCYLQYIHRQSCHWLVFLQLVWKFERSKLWAPRWGYAFWRDGFRAFVWSCLHLGIFDLHDLCHALRTHMLDFCWFCVCTCDCGARFALFSVKLQHFGVRSSHQWLQMWTALFSCCSVKAEAILLQFSEHRWMAGHHRDLRELSKVQHEVLVSSSHVMQWLRLYAFCAPCLLGLVAFQYKHDLQPGV